MKLLPLLLIGILTVTTIFFCANYQITKTEYEEYRNGIFARAYESVLSDLAAYIQTQDEALSSRVVPRLWELPLSDEEIEAVRRFASDMAAGAYHEAAQARALAYSETLFRYLSEHRTERYAESWRAAGMSLPAYPEEVPVGAAPETDLSLLRRDKASKLLENKSLLAYTRREGSVTLYAYRTASSYVELTEEGRLFRLLRSGGKGEDSLTEAQCRETARRFLERQDFSDVVLGTGTWQEGGYAFTFSHEREEGSLTVSEDGIVVRFQLVGLSP